MNTEVVRPMVDRYHNMQDCSVGTYHLEADGIKYVELIVPQFTVYW
jgi:hypothetical protein